MGRTNTLYLQVHTPLVFTCIYPVYTCTCTLYITSWLTLPSNQSFYRLIAGFGMGVADCEVYRPIVRGAHRQPKYIVIWHYLGCIAHAAHVPQWIIYQQVVHNIAHGSIERPDCDVHSLKTQVEIYTLPNILRMYALWVRGREEEITCICVLRNADVVAYIIMPVYVRMHCVICVYKAYIYKNTDTKSIVHLDIKKMYIHVHVAMAW